MHYMAGIFDAEGCVSLAAQGGQIISVQMCDEEIPNLFRNKFGGSVRDYKSENKKKVYNWTCPCKNIPFFISSIAPCSIFKLPQLILMGKYLDQTREERRSNRKEFITKISNCKKPPSNFPIHSLRFSAKYSPTNEFFEWLAGFMDGDGNFCCYEFESRFSSQRQNFSTTISCFNVMPSLIQYIQDRIEGSISVLKQNKNPVYKWVCLPKNSIYLCESVLPFIKIKKECCILLIEFIKIFNSKRTRILGKGTGKGNWQPYSFNEINRMREIIRIIKHQNSL